MSEGLSPFAVDDEHRRDLVIEKDACRRVGEESNQQAALAEMSQPRRREQGTHTWYSHRRVSSHLAVCVLARSLRLGQVSFVRSDRVLKIEDDFKSATGALQTENERTRRDEPDARE